MTTLRKRACGALVVALLGVLSYASPALAQDDAPSGDDVVVLTGGADIAEDETVGDVVIFDGDVRVDGTVDGDVVAFNGRVTVAGIVQGDVISFNGRVVAEAGSQIDGDVESRPEARIDPDADVAGDVGGFKFTRFDDAIAATRFALWIALSVSALLLGLAFVWLFPRAADRIVVAGESRTGAAIGWGLLLFFGLPILSILLLVTVVGIPLGIVLMLIIVPLYSLGYVASALFVGRKLIRPPRARALGVLVGIVILRVLALIPFLGGLTWFVATVYGLGMLAVAARTGREIEPVRRPATTPA
jgi:Polymer-forming cytoskeletal